MRRARPHLGFLSLSCPWKNGLRSSTLGCQRQGPPPSHVRPRWSDSRRYTPRATSTRKAATSPPQTGCPPGKPSGGRLLSSTGSTGRSRQARPNPTNYAHSTRSPTTPSTSATRRSLCECASPGWHHVRASCARCAAPTRGQPLSKGMGAIAQARRISHIGII